MTTTISTLIPDIQELIKRKDGWFTDDLSLAFATDVSSRLQSQLSEKKGAPTLRLSQMGPRCPKALWYSLHHPELAEPLSANAELMFSYGHILEALIITLAKAAGHEVTGEQDAVEVDGITGHRDCIIDGYLVDVKSATGRSFQKLLDGSIAEDDKFGYLDQLDGYLVGSYDDPLLRHKDRAFLLGINKEIGKLCLYGHNKREEHIRERIREYKEIRRLPSTPECACGTELHGKSGNIKLDVRASYSQYKHTCFPRLRTFLYADGPVYLTAVSPIRPPEVTEVDRYGNVIKFGIKQRKKQVD